MYDLNLVQEVQSKVTSRAPQAVPTIPSWIPPPNEKSAKNHHNWRSSYKRPPVSTEFANRHHNSLTPLQKTTSSTLTVRDAQLSTKLTDGARCEADVASVSWHEETVSDTL